MAVCHVCGKAKVKGNNVSHANNKTKRWNKPNLQKMKISEKGSIQNVHICTRCIKAGRVTKAL